MSDAKPADNRLFRIVGGLLALGLVIAVVMLAGPRTVWSTLRATRAQELGLAAGCAILTVVLRGLRLTLLLPPGRLGLIRASLIAGAAQAAALFVPARFGELALPWLLTRARAAERAAAVGTLLVARSFDLAGLGVWTMAGVILVWGGQRPLTLIAAAILLTPLLLMAPLLRAMAAAVTRWANGRGGTALRWARRLDALNAAVRELGQRPRRTAAAGAATLATWGSIWLMTWLLLAAMGHRWDWSTVVAGSAAASVANLLPVNLIANLGTLEAGWTAAFAALGVPVEVAAATGVSAHLWALIFAAALGAASWGALSASRDAS